MSDPAPRQRARVLLVINDLARAGAETQLVALARGLSRDRFEPAVVILKRANDFEEALREAGVPVTTLGRRGYWDPRVWSRLLRTVRGQRPAILHSHLFLGNLHGVVAGRAARVPFVVASQRTSYQASLSPPLRALARRLHGAADRVIVNARATFDEERAAGVPEWKLRYIPNGVAPPPTAGASRAASGLPEGPLVLAAGQLTEDKGHRYLLEAWPGVLGAHADARLVILGEGAGRRRLEERVAALGVASSVWLPGHRGDAARLLASCDVFAQPSVNEGMPNAVLEAMAAGRPVVATRVGGIPDVVDADSGILVPPREPAALATALCSFLADPDRRRAAGAAGRRRVASAFSVENMVARTAGLYEELLSGG